MATTKVSAMLISLSVCLNLAACVEIPNLRPSAASPTAISQGNPSPVAGSSTSQQVNQAAEIAAYKPIEYANASKKGPTIVVLPGGIKSMNATFNQRFLPNTIADFGELELSRANFTVLERSDLGPLMKEFELAYNLGDPDVARRMLQKGKLKATRWIVRFDVLKAEPVASANKSFDASAIGDIAGTLMGGKAGSVASIAGNSIRTDDASGMWLVGMRYKVLDANTTEQVATGYMEDKMEVGAKATSVLGVSNAATGQLTLDTLVQRLVQKTVAEIDAKHK
jgi:hypothetical protein